MREKTTTTTTYINGILHAMGSALKYSTDGPIQSTHYKKRKKKKMKEMS